MTDVYIDLQTVARLLKEDGELVLIDARTPEEYKASHASGSINVPIEDLPKYAQDYKKSRKDGLIVTMCGSKGRGEKGAALLAQHDVVNVKVMSGGLKAWKDENFPVE